MEKLNKILSRRKVLILSISAALICLGAVISGVSAKYVQETPDQTAVVRAKEFYFTSDLLKETHTEYSLNPGTDTLSFTLKNHGDDLRYSESDITYTVSVSPSVDNASYTVADADGDPLPSSAKLPGSTCSSATVVLMDLQDGCTYTVTVTGKGGYEKVLSAQFQILSPENQVYQHLEADPSGAFLALSVWTKDVSGDVIIQFPAGLIPDETDSALKGIDNYTQSGYMGGTAQSTLGAHSSHTYRFFLETPFAAFSIDDFTVTVGGIPAIDGIPG